jgi:hypothetical protein
MAESSELKIIITADDRAKDVLAGNKKSLLDLGSLASGALKFGMVAGAAGVAALGAELVASVGAAGDAELAQADLAAVLASTKGIAGLTAGELNQMASGLQDVTRFEDDTTLRGEAMLLTFTNIGRNVFPQATESMLDLATKMGMDVGSAAIMLGKALNDPIAGVTALRRVGVQLTDAQEAQIKSLAALGDVEGAQKIILGELQTELGGAARAAGDTFPGKLDILKNKFMDIQENIGGAMLPGLTLLGDKLIAVLNQPEVQAAIASLSKWLADELPRAIDWGVKLLGELQEGGLSGVLTRAKAWSENPATQAYLQSVGAQIGKGIVEGVKFTMTNAPVWASLAEEMGQVMAPLLWTVLGSLARGVALSLYQGFGLSAEEAEKRISSSLGARIFGTQTPAGYQFGGVVPGALGAPQLAMVHGGEMIVPTGERARTSLAPTAGTGGSSGNMTFIYSPQFSMADEREFQTRIAPMLDRWYADARRRRVVA